VEWAKRREAHHLWIGLKTETWASDAANVVARNDGLRCALPILAESGNRICGMCQGAICWFNDLAAKTTRFATLSTSYGLLELYKGGGIFRTVRDGARGLSTDWGEGDVGERPEG
jgi:hypothetical protein